MMKQKYTIIMSLFMLILLVPYLTMAQGTAKRLKVGYVRAKVVDSGDEGEGSYGWGEHPSYWDGFTIGTFSTKAVFLGCSNWTDTLGQAHNIKLSGHGQWETDDKRIMVPVADENDFTIHKYARYQPPAITVDGLRTDDPYPFNESDHVEPAYIPGTADEMVESWINTDMGVTIHQRVFAFAQKNHNKYQIYEWTFKNTGNVDADDDIELPGQTITDFYFLRQVRYFEDFGKPACTTVGIMPGETLRMVYGYPHRQEGAEYDDTGSPWLDTGYLDHPYFNGEAILFASAAVNDMNNDDINQPSQTGYFDCDFEPATYHSLSHTENQKQMMWTVMTEGFFGLEGVEEQPGSKPGHHSVPFDEQEYLYPTDYPFFGFTISGFWSCGPYTLAFGDSIKIVWAQVFGAISSEKGREVGTAWLEDDCHFGDDVIGGADDNLPPNYQVYPELYEEDAFASEQSNWAKDCWVMTGHDSIRAVAMAAKWAYENNYDVPQAPPPPSIEVLSMSDQIRVSWGSESEAAADFSGYRVYRARGQWFPGIPEYEYEFLGGWDLIFECGGNSGNPVVYIYDDTEAQRGISYYYYVVAFDDGTDNGNDYDGQPVGSLTSSMFANMTTQPVSLTRPAGTLETVAIVPNPYNISASQLQFTGDLNKIMFFGLPEQCTIRIFTESGDLVKTIEHLGSGDEPWGKVEFEWQTTDDGQLVVSGIYIAHIETPDGKSVIKKFVVVR